VTRSIPEWQYLAFGTWWVIAGAWIILGSLLAHVSNLLIVIPVGALIVGVGGYWLWRFHRVHRQHVAAGGVTPSPH